jgi:hypothetical protein
MESAGLLIGRRPRPLSRPSLSGRYSRGIERDPETPAKQRVGRFCDGIAHGAPDATIGRFSTGIERVPDVAALRVGSFADGFELVAR